MRVCATRNAGLKSDLQPPFYLALGAGRFVRTICCLADHPVEENTAIAGGIHRSALQSGT